MLICAPIRISSFLGFVTTIFWMPYWPTCKFHLGSYLFRNRLYKSFISLSLSLAKSGNWVAWIRSSLTYCLTVLKTSSMASVAIPLSTRGRAGSVAVTGGAVPWASFESSLPQANNKAVAAAALGANQRNLRRLIVTPDREFSFSTRHIIALISSSSTFLGLFVN